MMTTAKNQPIYILVGADRELSGSTMHTLHRSHLQAYTEELDEELLVKLEIAVTVLVVIHLSPPRRLFSLSLSLSPARRLLHMGEDGEDVPNRRGAPAGKSGLVGMHCRGGRAENWRAFELETAVKLRLIKGAQLTNEV